MGFGEKILIGAERKFGNLAFPGILRWIAGFQLLVFLLSLGSPSFIEAIIFNREEILKGEVWRIISWLFIPRGQTFLVIITVLFTFFINDLIENSIGSFRLNAYVVGMVIALIIPAFSPLSNPVFTSLMPFIFFSAMIFAAASLVPNYEILLMLIIPIKMKWLAWMDAAILFAMVAQIPWPFSLITAILVMFGLLPFFLGIFPSIFFGLKNNASAAARRSKFQRDTALAGDSFHTCHGCGVTDSDDPTMEFRVSAEDGEEYCQPCRKKMS